MRDRRLCLRTLPAHCPRSTFRRSGLVFAVVQPTPAERRVWDFVGRQRAGHGRFCARMMRVLILSFFFPPVINMGSHRMARFVRHLPEFGWQPVVLTAPGAADVPGTEIHRVAGLDLTRLWR